MSSFIKSCSGYNPNQLWKSRIELKSRSYLNALEPSATTKTPIVRLASNSALRSASSGSMLLGTADALRSSVAPGCVVAWICCSLRIATCV